MLPTKEIKQGQLQIKVFKVDYRDASLITFSLIVLEIIISKIV